MREIIGNLDSELVETYVDLIGQRVLEEEAGGRYAVAFNGEHAIKYPHPTTKNARAELINEYNIGRGLKEIGANVPRMHGIFVNDNGTPFLVQQTLDLTIYENLPVSKREKAERQFSEQVELVKSHGFVPGDLSIFDNCGVRKSDGNLYFFDFTDWERN
jgi:RIO-like serine/threonine protein kinase